jgi:hypothetical protein
MTRSMPDPAVPVPSASPFSRRFVEFLDAVTILVALLLLSNLVFEGFRVRFGDVRVAITSPVRTLIVLLIVAGVRHWLRRSPTVLDRLRGALRSAWSGAARPLVLPAAIASRLMVLAVGFMAVALVGYPQGAPPHRISHNELVNLPIRWDAGWYLQIALDGYRVDRRTRLDRQQNIAFFPAYPMLSRVGAAWLGARSAGFGDEIRGNRVEWEYFQHRRVVAAAMLISFGAFAWSLVYLFRLTRELYGDEVAQGAVLVACAYPYALFFSAMYTESLFFLTMLGAFYHLRRQDYLIAGIWGLVAGLTRPNGCLLSVPLAILAIQHGLAVARATPGARTITWTKGLLASAMPGIGMIIFSAYLYQETGRPLAWMDAHQAWGRVATDVEALVANRVAFIANEGIYKYSISEPVELLNAVPTVLALLLAIPVMRRVGLAYGVLILLMLVPPLARGGFLSLGRVTATLFPLFIYAGLILHGHLRSGVVLAMAGLQALLAVLFFTWRPFY